MNRNHPTSRGTLRPLAAYTAVCVAGLAIGLGGSVVKPGPWFGPRDAFDRLPEREPRLPEREPRLREVLCAEGECAYIADMLETAAGVRVVALYWLRGREGREALRVRCGPPHIVTDLGGAARRGGPLDAVARAACAPEPAAEAEAVPT